MKSGCRIEQLWTRSAFRRMLAEALAARQVEPDGFFPSELPRHRRPRPHSLSYIAQMPSKKQQDLDTYSRESCHGAEVSAISDQLTC